MTLFEAIKEYYDDQLLQYLEEIESKGNHAEVMQMHLFEGKICTTLQLTLKFDRSAEVISSLIDIGGKKLVMMCEESHGSALHWACSTNENVSIEIISKMLEVGGKELVMLKTKNNGTALHWACMNKHISIDIVSKLLEVGGKELVMIKTRNNENTALHFACKDKNISIEIISKLLEVGGKELAMMKTGYIQETALHWACKIENVSADIISRLLEVGGKELLMTGTRNNGENALHCACKNEAISTEIISQLVEAGGKELVMIKTQHYKDETALHFACKNKNISIDIVSKLLEVGGKELAMMKNIRYETALKNFVEMNKNISIGIIFKLIEVGGKELMTEHLVGKGTALQFVSFSCSNIANDAFIFMVKEYILANIGGEFGIGGLFNDELKYIRDRIYRKWSDISPGLESALGLLQEQVKPPILHAAIVAKAPSHVIKDIVNRFEYSILKTDSFNRIPIEIASEKCLGWSEGMQEIVEATSLALQQGSSIYVAAKYGLKWKNHMKELAEINAVEVTTGHDNLTGLSLFMVAAMGESCDLSSIYGMMKMSPAQIMKLDDESTNKRRRLK